MTPSSKAATAALSLSFLLAAGGALAQSLPDGAAKEMVEAVCTGCHQVNPILRSVATRPRGGRS